MADMLPDSVFDTPAPTQPAMLPDSVFENSSASQVPAINASTPTVDPVADLLGANMYVKPAQDILAGLAQAGHGLLNAPHNIVNMISPSLAAKIPTQQNYDFSSLAGNQNPDIADKLLQGAAKYSYVMPLGGALGTASVPARLAGQALAGGTYGLTQSQNPALGALEGAGINTALGGLGEGISALPAGIKNYLSRFTVKGLGNQIEGSLEDAKNASNAQAFELAKQNYNNYTNNEQTAWTNLSSMAKTADAAAPNYGYQFDNSDYVNSLQNKLSNLTGQSARQSGYARSNDDAIKLLNGYINDQHSTFSDAIEHNKALNQDYQNEITPGKSLPFDIVNYAKDNLKKTIQNNLSSTGLQPSLGQAWNDANNITAQKNQIFNQLATPRGGNSISSFSQLIKNNGQYADPTGFVNDYLPTSRGDGTQKMQQFSQMLGDDNQAKNILKMNYFDKTFSGTGNQVDIPKFLARYNGLSTDQQNYLFQPDENNTIQALNKISENYPAALKKEGAISSFGHATIPALLGAVGAHATGSGEFLGALAGLGGAKLAQRGMTQLFSNPAISNYFVKSLMAPPSGANIGQLLTNKLMPAVTNPALMQQLNP